MLNKFLKRKKINKHKKGFTLIEITVILFIISVGLIGVLSLVIQNIQSQVINKNNIIAYQLAQEGIELVRKTRDTNWKNGVSWNLGLADGSYYMDYLDDEPTLITGASDSELHRDMNNFYVHGGGVEQTNFSRTIEITNIDAKSMSVKAIVVWKSKNNTSDYEVETILYDWY
jgi:Tfp pilus assembly protein PilV